MERAEDRGGADVPSPSPILKARGRRPSLGELMILIAGIGIGLAAIRPMDDRWDSEDPSTVILVYGGMALGGVSFIGVPLLLWERRRRPRPRFGPGRLLWFAHGSAAWLLWPPIIIGHRAVGRGQDPPIIDPAASQICYFYGTPLMAVYVMTALVAGGWVRPRGRRARNRVPLPWRERFGLILGCGWAVLGLYVLSMLYRNKFR